MPPTAKVISVAAPPPSATMLTPAPVMTFVPNLTAVAAVVLPVWSVTSQNEP